MKRLSEQNQKTALPAAKNKSAAQKVRVSTPTKGQTAPILRTEMLVECLLNE
jgi:hypothetical protein